MKTLSRLAAGVGLAAGAYALVLRPRMLRWGATAAELAAPSVGADLIPDGKRLSLMAITLEAPPSAVWPWLVQMGHDRAGWYSFDRLDRSGIPSARSLHPEWQSLSVGQRLAATPDGKHWFEVAALEPERLLALRNFSVGGVQQDPVQPRPPAFTDSLWAFQLVPLPAGRTRLLVTVHTASKPWLPNAVMGVAFWEPAHFIMQTRQFSNLRLRLETSAPQLRAPPAVPPPATAPRSGSRPDPRHS